MLSRDNEAFVKPMDRRATQLLCSHFFLRSIYFIRVNVPETKGLTLEEIEQKFLIMRIKDDTSEHRPLVQGAGEGTDAKNPAAACTDSGGLSSRVSSKFDTSNNGESDWPIVSL